jgi:hypothetical protein
MVGRIAIPLMKRALNDMMSERPRQPGQPSTRHHGVATVINNGRYVIDTNEARSFQDQRFLAGGGLRSLMHSREWSATGPRMGLPSFGTKTD